MCPSLNRLLLRRDFSRLQPAASATSFELVVKSVPNDPESAGFSLVGIGFSLVRSSYLFAIDGT
jgi:hypothetical protein